MPGERMTSNTTEREKLFSFLDFNNIELSSAAKNPAANEKGFFLFSFEGKGLERIQEKKKVSEWER